MTDAEEFGPVPGGSVTDGQDPRARGSLLGSSSYRRAEDIAHAPTFMPANRNEFNPFDFDF